MKCYFIRTDSTASNDMGKPYIFSGKSIHEARMHFMHVHTLPNLAKYMARYSSLNSYRDAHLCNSESVFFRQCLFRFSLILSKTRKLEVDMNGIAFQQIDDIHCLVLSLTHVSFKNLVVFSLYFVDLFPLSSNCRIKTVMMFLIRIRSLAYIQMELATSLRTLLGCVQ